jgi:hypothetical protein
LHVGVRLTTAVLLSLCMASPADAQLGKLRKAAQDLAKEKLGTKTESTAATTSSSSGAGTSFAITPEFIQLVLESVEATVAQAERQQAAKRASDAYAQEQAAAKQCVDKLVLAYNPATAGVPSEARSAEISRLTDAASAVQERAIAAMQRNDRRTYFAAQDTASVLMQQSAALTLGGSCRIPYMSLATIDAQLSAQEDHRSANLEPTAATRQRMTRAQFGRVRERIALWGLLQEDPSLKVGSEGVFSDAERAALTARNTDIRRLTPYFKDNTLHWSTWGDVTSW